MREGKILALGTKKEIEKHIGPLTQVLYTIVGGKVVYQKSSAE